MAAFGIFLFQCAYADLPRFAGVARDVAFKELKLKLRISVRGRLKGPAAGLALCYLGAHIEVVGPARKMKSAR
jgi:hypothetical protein